MPAPLAKGILISLSILAAVGIAVYENPQFKEWVEDQRRKITEFLRTFGDQLDPQSRREAEAFAYEGRLPLQSREEAVAARQAVAIANGRETGDDSITRRNRTSITPQSPDEVEERRRLGREYLARRNQEMLDLKERQKTKKGTSDLSEKSPLSPTFDQLVNIDGSLKVTDKELSDQTKELNEKTLELPSVPTDEPKSLRSIPTQESTVETAFTTGSHYANPFSDEFELSGPLDSRTSTPKPPVPPKIALGDKIKLQEPSILQKEPWTRQTPLQQEPAVPENLSYEEQLIRAMSISLAESEELARQARLAEQEQRDADFAAAVAASLADVERMQRRRQEQDKQPVVALTPDPPVSVPVAETDGDDDDDDDLYTLSPDLVSRGLDPAFFSLPITIPPPFYDPVHEAASASAAAAVAPQTPTTTADFASPVIERDAISLSSSSSSASSAHHHHHASAPASVVGSEISLIDFGEVESVGSEEEESDDEADGVLTPGSWTDVGSDVGSED